MIVAACADGRPRVDYRRSVRGFELALKAVEVKIDLVGDARGGRANKPVGTTGWLRAVLTVIALTALKMDV